MDESSENRKQFLIGHFRVSVGRVKVPSKITEWFKGVRILGLGFVEGGGD